jgi:hypothetical protein
MAAQQGGNGRLSAGMIVGLSQLDHWRYRRHSMPRRSLDMQTELKIYCDTNTLPDNADICKEEAEALKQLRSIEGLKWFTSHIVGHEATRTKDESKRSKLLDQHAERELIPKDEKVVWLQRSIGWL